MATTEEQNLLGRVGRAADLEEIRHEALSCLGGARVAGVDPEALRGVVGCAVALGATGIETYAAGMGWAAGHPDEDVFLSHVDDIDTEVVERLRLVRGLAAETGRALEAANGDLDDALDDLAAAKRALAAARAMPVTDPCHGCHGARDAAIHEAGQEIRDAEKQIEDCQRRIRVCERAAGALAQAKTRLDHAAARIGAVPGDVEEVYELMHDWRRRVGQKARLADDPREFHTGTG